MADSSGERTARRKKEGGEEGGGGRKGGESEWDFIWGEKGVRDKQAL